MKNPKKILLIIQRSNGDVFLSSSLIKSLYENCNHPRIDLLVNDDTYSIAKLVPFVKNIYTFSYKKKDQKRWSQEKNIILSLFRKYDLSINLTASDRSVLYALVASSHSISALEGDLKKSWWKKLFLSHYYFFDDSEHILTNNLKPLNYLNISTNKIHHPIQYRNSVSLNIKEKLNLLNIKDFIIFHPSAQYHYKIYPKHLRNKLLIQLNNLKLPIVVTGRDNPIDNEIKKNLPKLSNVIDFIGETSLEELFALTDLSLGYIGMDTLNMHIAASLNKPIFAIFGPTNLKMWSPWSNSLQTGATKDMPIQKYGNITIFQAGLPCVACGKAGCDNNLGRSECLHIIDPVKIFNQVNIWYKNESF